jgi:enolase
MSQLLSLHAREILDSRGNPTIEVEATTEKSHATAAVPSGASTGTFEAVELRDNDKARFLGKGVLKAVENVNNILAKELKGLAVEDQNTIDTKMLELDGTTNKAQLGANAILGVSLAVAKAAALDRKVEFFEHFAELANLPAPNILPIPMLNVLNAGVHGGSAVEIQEFMIFPQGANSFREALRISAEVYQTLKKILTERHWPVAVGDEGGFAPPVKSNAEAIELILEAIQKAGHADKVNLTLDAAANEFYVAEKKQYCLDGKELSSDELVNFYAELVKKYPIVSLEDGLAEEDWSGWQKLNAQIGQQMQIVGDDLFVTNVERLKRGLVEKSANAILIKLNQIGTVTETIAAVKLARDSGWSAVISHRSGETEDTTIADLAVGLGTGQIKTGAPCRSERVAKYNRLLKIEELLGEKAQYGKKL